MFSKNHACFLKIANLSHGMEAKHKMINLIIPLLPVIILSIALTLLAVLSILKQKNFKRGNKVMWLVIAILIQFIGPGLYFLLGREG